MFFIIYGKSSICYIYVNVCIIICLIYVWKFMFDVRWKSLYYYIRFICVIFLFGFVIGEIYIYFVV